MKPVAQINYPKLRFKDEQGKDFSDWEEIELSEIGKTFNGLIGKNKTHFGRGKPYIQYLQIFENSKINVSNCGLVSVKKIESQNRVRRGDIFFTTSSETPNEVGTASVLLDDVQETYLNSFCFGFRICKKSLLPEFAQFAFRENRFRKKVVRLSQGSTRFNLSKTAFMRLSIKLPPVKEQQKIASFLSSVDRKIEQLTQKKASLEQYKKGLMQKLFSQEIRFKDEQGKDFPEWEGIKLGKLSKVVRGVTFGKDDTVEYAESGRIPVLRAGNISDELILDKGLIWLREEKISNSQWLEKGDIVMCASSGSSLIVGKCALVRRHWKGTVGAFCFIIRVNSIKCNSDYLSNFLKSERFRKWSEAAAGTNIKNIRMGELQNFQIPMPSFQEQQRIASFLTAIDSKIELVSEQVERMQTFKKGLLQQMFV